MENKPTIEEEIVKMLRTVYDPEIPVNIYDLGLIYNIEENDGTVKIEMTLTAPNCPAADFIIEDVRMKVESIENVKNVDIQLVFEPEWDKNSNLDFYNTNHAGEKNLLRIRLSFGSKIYRESHRIRTSYR